MSGKLEELAGRRVVLLLCGGNIDPNVLSRVVERGLVAEGRLGRFTAVISDRPGGLAELSALSVRPAPGTKKLCNKRRFPGRDTLQVKVLGQVKTADPKNLSH